MGLRFRQYPNTTRFHAGVVDDDDGVAEVEMADVVIADVVVDVVVDDGDGGAVVTLDCRSLTQMGWPAASGAVEVDWGCP